MKRTIYLSDDLADRVEQFLSIHPRMTLSGLVQEALEERLAPRDVTALLELAGLVPEASTHARERAEDEVIRHER